MLGGEALALTASWVEQADMVEDKGHAPRSKTDGGSPWLHRWIWLFQWHSSLPGRRH